MKGLDEKRKELVEMETSLQKEHEEHALWFAKSKCSSIFKDVTNVKVVTESTFNFVMSNNFQGGNHDQSELFEITSNEFKISAIFTRRGFNYKEAMNIKWNTEIVPNISDVLAYDDVKLPFADINDQYERAVVCSKFWNDLELFIFIYASKMMNCPVKHQRPLNLDQFSSLFSNLRFRN